MKLHIIFFSCFLSLNCSASEQFLKGSCTVSLEVAGAADEDISVGKPFATYKFKLNKNVNRMQLCCFLFLFKNKIIVVNEYGSINRLTNKTDFSKVTVMGGVVRLPAEYHYNLVNFINMRGIERHSSPEIIESAEENLRGFKEKYKDDRDLIEKLLELKCKNN